MSKQIQSGDEQNLELSESRAAIEKLAASKQQQAEASEKSIEDDSEKGKKLRLLSICRRRLLIEPEVYASAAQKWPQKLLKQLMLLKEW
jgi:hypothetical protein